MGAYQTNHVNHECVICMSEMKPDNEEIKNTHCNHMFHRHCLTAWLINHNTCPLCRGDITEEREVARNLEADFDDAADEFSHVAEMYDNLVQGMQRMRNDDVAYEFSHVEEMYDNLVQGMQRMRNDDVAYEFSHVEEMLNHLVNERIIYDTFDDGRFFLLDATSEDIDFIHNWNELNPSYEVIMVEH
jgi:hypothetical protein